MNITKAVVVNVPTIEAFEQVEAREREKGCLWASERLFDVNRPITLDNAGRAVAEYGRDTCIRISHRTMVFGPRDYFREMSNSVITVETYMNPELLIL